MTPENLHPHLAKLFKMTLLRLGDINLSFLLDKSLCKKPWLIADIDWNAIESFGITSLDELTEEDGRIKFIESSGFCDCAIAAALLSPSEPPIMASPSVLFAHLDEIFWRYPGVRFVFGCSLNEGILEPISDVLAEYNGAETVKYIRSSTYLKDTLP